MLAVERPMHSFFCQRTLLPTCATLLTLSFSLLSSGCFEDNVEPAGLRVTRLTDGPTVKVDLSKRPFPEIPYPNDLATRPDPRSPTGLRVNVSEFGGTAAEERVRREINKQTGFGVYSPITVSFDKPLDVQNIIDRHQEPIPSFEDDALFLVNVDPDSPGYGELVMLDMGRGNYPLALKAPHKYFKNDTRAHGTNLLYETVGEPDLNGNGLFDPHEDTDDDDVQDVPNLLDPDADPWAFGQLLDFYERQTNTLVIRPLRPLRPGTRYAVVLTKALVGEDGGLINSPYNFINHTRQTPHLEPLRELLPTKLPGRFDKTLDGVSFAWTFTTRTPHREVDAIRDGLYGHGSMAWLAKEYPAKVELLHNAQGMEAENPLIFKVDELIPVIAPIAGQLVGQAGARALEDSFEQVDYVVSGSFLSPHFLVDDDGLAEPIPTADEIEAGDHLAIDRLELANDDESFDLDVDTGYARHQPDEIPFICVIPKPSATQQAPFPTIVYSHAIGSTRFEGLVFAGSMAKLGMATCTIDAARHGAPVPAEFENILDQIARLYDLDNLPGIINHDRADDLDGDGTPDSGGDYFTTDLLRSRDHIRQTTIDQLQLVRLLRTFDGKTRFSELDESSPYVKARRDIVAGFDADGDGSPELAGDFNGDGVPDLGGDVGMVGWGTSLGGLHSTVLAGAEPRIRAVASNAGGGGILDIASRTEIANARVASLLRTFGPLLVGEPVERDGKRVTRLGWVLPEVTSERTFPFAYVEDLQDGDIIILRNLDREENRWVPHDEVTSHGRVREGRFRLAIAADGATTGTRRATLGTPSGINVKADIIGCVERSSCEEVDCPDSSYCSAEGECKPLATCVEDFDFSATLDDDAHERHVIREPLRFGDRLLVEIYRSSGELVRTIDTFELNISYNNLVYPAGTPLAALAEGWGLKRQTPQTRRFFGIGQMLLEPADPVVWAATYQRDEREFDYERAPYNVARTNSLIIGTLGDQTVPINTAMSLARAAGSIDARREHNGSGMTENQILVQNYVYEGIHWLDRFPEHPQTLFDPDDLDNGRFRSTRGDKLPSPEPDAPLRITRKNANGGTDALRLAYVDERGAHTINAPNPSLAFDIHTFMLNQIGLYLASGGAEVTDATCMEADITLEACEFFDRDSFETSFQDIKQATD